MKHNPVTSNLEIDEISSQRDSSEIFDLTEMRVSKQDTLKQCNVFNDISNNCGPVLTVKEENRNSDDINVSIDGSITSCIGLLKSPLFSVSAQKDSTRDTNFTSTELTNDFVKQTLLDGTIVSPAKSDVSLLSNMSLDLDMTYRLDAIDEMLTCCDDEAIMSVNVDNFLDIMKPDNFSGYSNTEPPVNNFCDVGTSNYSQSFSEGNSFQKNSLKPCTAVKKLEYEQSPREVQHEEQESMLSTNNSLMHAAILSCEFSESIDILSEGHSFLQSNTAFTESNLSLDTPLPEVLSSADIFDEFCALLPSLVSSCDTSGHDNSYAAFGESNFSTNKFEQVNNMDDVISERCIVDFQNLAKSIIDESLKGGALQIPEIDLVQNTVVDHDSNEHAELRQFHRSKLKRSSSHLGSETLEDIDTKRLHFDENVVIINPERDIEVQHLLNPVIDNTSGEDKISNKDIEQKCFKCCNDFSGSVLTHCTANHAVCTNCISAQVKSLLASSTSVI